MTAPAEVVGGRVVLTARGAQMVAVALRRAAAAALGDGIDWRARSAADEFTVLLGMCEAAVGLAANGQQTADFCIFVPGSAEVLTTAQAAEIIGAAPRTVVGLIARGVLPARRHGRAWLVSEYDARRLAREGRRRRAESDARPRVQCGRRGAGGADHGQRAAAELDPVA